VDASHLDPGWQGGRVANSDAGNVQVLEPLMEVFSQATTGP
jgi:hypothetical protein